MRTTAVAVIAGLGLANAFAPCQPVVSSARPVATCAAPASAHAPMMMSAGRSGSRAGIGSLSKVIRNVVMGNSKKSSGGNGLNGGNGNNQKPPSGPLSASGAAGNDGRKAQGLGALWAAYNASLDKRPILTKALTSGLGFALGDFLAQKFIDKRDEIDMERLARMASFGLLIHGPTGHFFYGFLDSKIPGTAALTVATKVFIDQVIWNPIFGTMFFSYMGAAEGLGVEAIKARVQKNLWASVKGSWTVWPVAHAINFRFIPTSQRLLYINSIQIGYNMFLSVLGQRANQDIAPEVEGKVNRAKAKAKNAANKVKENTRNTGKTSGAGAKKKIVKDSLLNRTKSIRD